MKTPLRWCYRCSRSELKNRGSAPISCAESKSKCVRKISTESKRLSPSQLRQLFHLALTDGSVIFTMTSLSCLLFSYSQRLLNIVWVGTHRERNGKLRIKWIYQKPKKTYLHCVSTLNYSMLQVISYNIVLASRQHVLMALVSVDSLIQNWYTKSWQNSQVLICLADQ